MNEKKLENKLIRLLQPKNGVREVCSFEDAGILTRNRGIILTFVDGSQYQIEVLQSRGSRR